MSITLDVNAFLNKDVCATGCDDIAMEKEMETNIFDEIEHLLKFNKDLEHENQHKGEECKKKKVDETKLKEMANFDFFNTNSDDFLLTSDSQSLLGEDSLLFTVEQDRLQPISSKFMVPGIYKRIEEGVASNETKLECRKCNVFISELERQGRIIRQKDFDRLYVLAEECEAPPLRRVILLEPMECSDDVEEVEEVGRDENKNMSKRNSKTDQIPKEWDALNRLAYDILKLTNRDHIVIDRKRNEIVRTEYSTQQKTIYRFLAPELMGLKPDSGSANNIIDVDEEDKFTMSSRTVNKHGRPKKRCQEQNAAKVSNKLNKKEEKSNTVLDEKKSITSPQTNIRTRSGRLIRTPTTTQDNNILLPPPTPQEKIKDLVNELKDTDYKNSKLSNKRPSTEINSSAENTIEISIDSTQQSPLKRKVPPEAICPTCKKIFLGRRLQRHFTQHPDHMKVTSTNATPSAENNADNGYYPTDDMSLFRFLITKLQNSQTLNEDQKADLFLNELNDLIEQIQLRSSRLIRNTSGLHFVNQRCSKLLGIPEGQYALDISAIEAPLDPELTDNSLQNNHSQPSNINTRSLDYTNLSITLDETLTDEAAQKLNLSAGGKLLPPSEESLLRAVDDLVQTDINKIHRSSMLQQQPVDNSNSLTTSANSTSVVAKILPPHLDHVSDNAVEASHMKETSTSISATESPLLNLSVDFFQFNN